MPFSFTEKPNKIPPCLIQGADYFHNKHIRYIYYKVIQYFIPVAIVRNIPNAFKFSL